MKNFVRLLSLCLVLVASAAPAPAATTNLSPRAVRVLCKALSTSNITRSGPQTLDTISLTTGDVACLVGESDNKNGAYLVQASTWKAIDPGIGTGLEMYALSGSANVNAVYGCDTTGAITWGTTTTTWTKKSGVGAAFDPAAPGPIGGTTPAAITGTTVQANSGFVGSSHTAGGTNPLALQSGVTSGSGVSSFTFTSTTSQNTNGGGLVEFSNNNGQGGVGNAFYGYVSGGQSDALCDGVILTASGAITAGQVVVWTGTKYTVAAAAASGALTTIAGVAVADAASSKVRVCTRGLVYVNAVAGTNGANTVSTSGATAGSVATTAAASGALIGRTLENVGTTVAGKCLLQLILG